MIEKIKRWIKNHKKETIIGSSLFVVIFIFLISYSLAVLTPVKSIVITSKNTSFEDNEAGSWQVVKSAKWTGVGEAEVSFDLNTVGKYVYENRDIILVIDTSDSMSNDNRIGVVRDNSVELISSVFDENSNNRISLITFNDDSTLVSDFTRDENYLIDKISNLKTSYSTNYYSALINVDKILKNYTFKDDTCLVVLFLTDGYPCLDTPNEVGQYQYLKSQYPDIVINGIQYEMGNIVLDAIKNISDNQYVADMKILNNVLFEASKPTVLYDNFQIVDYIDNDYFKLDSEDDVEVSQGTVKLSEENGKQKIVWNLDGLASGRSGQLTMKLNLKDEYVNQGGNYSTNDETQVVSSMKNDSENVTNTNSPVLADNYKVIYDANSPGDCDVENLPTSENKSVYNTIQISSQTPTCSGYKFKGWEIVTDDVTIVNDDYFIMPESDVTIRAKWSKIELAKTMNGAVSTPSTLYALIQQQSVMDNKASTYVSSSGGIDFSNNSSDTNGKGVYTRAGTEGDDYPVHYYRGAVNNNHVKFGEFCWKIVRTTSTGGIKLIYDGTPDNQGRCNRTGTDATIGISSSIIGGPSPSSIGYMRGTSHVLNDYVFGTASPDYYIGRQLWYEYLGLSQSVNQMMTTGRYSYYYADSVTYSNGTYTLNNPKQYTSSMWTNSYRDLVGKYLCTSTESTTCSNVSYSIATDSSSLTYVSFRNGDTYETMIEKARDIKWIFGNDVTWDGSSYTLVDTVEISPIDWETEYNKISSKYHYTCLSTNNTCESVYYLLSTNISTNLITSASSIYYHHLENGQKIDDLREEMFDNLTDSSIKETIDNWFSDNMISYQKYLEDTVWCNDRSVYYGSLDSKDSPMVVDESNTVLFFNSYNNLNSHRPLLTCPNKNDSFTVDEANGNGDLTYPTALLTVDEMMLAGASDSGIANVDFYLYPGSVVGTFTMSPSYYKADYPWTYYYMLHSGVLRSINSGVSFPVRPSISLIPETLVVSGDGSSENPYIVDFPKN